MASDLYINILFIYLFKPFASTHTMDI